MHEHADAEAVFLSNGDVKFGLPDDTAQESHPKARTAQWTPAGKHRPEDGATILLSLLALILAAFVSLRRQGKEL